MYRLYVLLEFQERNFEKIRGIERWNGKPSQGAVFSALGPELQTCNSEAWVLSGKADEGQSRKQGQP